MKSLLAAFVLNNFLVVLHPALQLSIPQMLIFQLK